MFGLFGGLLQGDVITLQPAADTRLREQSPAEIDGSLSTFVSGTQGSFVGGTRNRALLRFDPASAIPAHSQINSAQLLLTVVMAPFDGTDSTFELHRLLEPWTESEATWQIRLAPDVAWAAPGATAGLDYAEAMSATQFIAGVGGYTFESTSDLVADVQGWLDDPNTNSGWILISQSESVEKTARHFASRENTNSTPPQLVLDFTPPPRIDRVEIVSNQILLHFQIEAGKSYVVQQRPLADTGDWSVLTNLPPPTVTTNVVISDVLGPKNGFYRIGRF
jgi:hypothetical protein